MKVVLLTATGRAGRTILGELVSRGHEVTAVARNLDKLPEQLPATVKRVRDDLDDEARIAEIIKGADAVVSAFGPSGSDPRYATDETYTDQLVSVTERAIAAVRKAGVSRSIVVGGCGSPHWIRSRPSIRKQWWPAMAGLTPTVLLVTSKKPGVMSTTLMLLWQVQRRLSSFTRRCSHCIRIE